MDSSRKFTDENLQGEELEAFTEKFLTAKFDRDRKKRWGKILEEEHNIPPQKEKVRKRKTRMVYLWVGAIAAAIALLFIIYPNLLNPTGNSYQQLADSFLQEDFYSNQGISKGDIDLKQLSIDAATAYNNKDFVTAIDLYAEIAVLPGAEEEHYFFLGLSYLYNENFPKAIEVLAELEQSESSAQFEQETRWFLALAYLRNNETDKAKPLLNQVKDSNWNNQKAAQLLKLLE